MQIGQESIRKDKAEYLVLVQWQFLGTTVSKYQLHSVRQKNNNTWLLVKQLVRLFG